MNSLLMVGVVVTNKLIVTRLCDRLCGFGTCSADQFFFYCVSLECCIVFYVIVYFGVILLYKELLSLIRECCCGRNKARCTSFVMCPFCSLQW